ncbi:MFS transporter [Clostridium sp. MB40-C1]|nr:MFS transporter [Clostridium sp. MB40-C1]WMJ81727.1 MFS transporter [Clostridium sp. MB40-C1]
MDKKPIFALKLATFVIALVYSLILPVMPFYMENLGAGGREFGWLTAVYALAQTVCAPFWGALSDRIGRKPIISIGIIGYSISLFLFVWLHPFGRCLSLAVYQVFCHLLRPLRLWHMSEIPARRKKEARI